jgi:hypothetical protein
MECIKSDLEETSNIPNISDMFSPLPGEKWQMQ